MAAIFDLFGQGRDREARASKIHGFVVGLVTNNKDPEKLGRVKVKFPWLCDGVDSWWARIGYAMAGKERGFWWIPEIDDEVLVCFEHGDVRFPYVVGGLHNGVDVPPQCDDITSTFGGVGYDHGPYSCAGRDFNEDGKNDLRFIRSRSGHLLVFDDKEGQEKITICDKTGKHRIEVFADTKKVVLTSADGDIELIADKKILMRCENLVTESRANTSMSAGGTFTATSVGDMTHKTEKNMSREAKKTIHEESGLSTTIKAGTTMTVKSGSAMTIESGAKLSLTAGATGKLKSGGTLTIRGALVKIN